MEKKIKEFVAARLELIGLVLLLTLSIFPCFIVLLVWWFFTGKGVTIIERYLNWLLDSLFDIFERNEEKHVENPD